MQTRRSKDAEDDMKRMEEDYIASLEFDGHTKHTPATVEEKRKSMNILDFMIG